VPEFRVIVPSARFPASLAFYGDQLGWPVTKDFPGGRIFGCGAEARIEVLDVPSAPRSTTSCALEIDDVDALHDRLVEAGITLVQPPVDQPWGHRNMAIEDPDGTKLIFFHVLG
jgi:catechol 2,3-dioxygenase-like lactoylglutathione lyase family enzyme